MKKETANLGNWVRAREEGFCFLCGTLGESYRFYKGQLARIDKAENPGTSDDVYEFTFLHDGKTSRMYADKFWQTFELLPVTEETTFDDITTLKGRNLIRT